MTDSELLELAAKAYLPDENYTNAAYMRGFFSNWNPLTDDGAALRLGCGLGFNIRVDLAAKRVDVISQYGEISITEYFVENSNDLYAATRRAIVRAAAELGKAM